MRRTLRLVIATALSVVLATAVVAPSAAAPAADAQATVVATGSVSGTLKLKGTGPAKNASIRALQWDGSWWDEVASTTSASDGSYHLDVPVGTVRIRFRPNDLDFLTEYNGGGYDVEQAPDLEIAEGGATVINAAFDLGGVVSGSVLDSFGNPIPELDIDIEYIDHPGLGGPAMSLKSNGDFVTRAVAPYPFILRAYDGKSAFAPRYFPKDWLAEDAKAITVALGTRKTGVKVVLPRRAYYSGTMTEAGGSSSPDGTVGAYLLSDDGAWELYEEFEVTGGTFVAAPLPPAPTVLRFTDTSDASYGPEFFGPSRFAESATPFELAAGSAATGVTVALAQSTGDIGEGDPTFVGAERVGDVLEAPLDGWADGAEFRILWTRDGAEIPASLQQPSYTVRPADLGSVIEVVVTAGAPGYANSSLIQTSDPIGAGVIDPVGTPKIAGTPKVGDVVKANPGVWMSGVAFSYRWFRDGVEIPKKSGKRTYTVVKADKGHDLTVRVTGARSAFESASVFSAAKRV